MTKRTLSDRIVEADTLASRYLGNANEASEKGYQTKVDKFYAKSQYWLDRYIILTKQGDRQAN
jgi:hypothetical protein